MDSSTTSANTPLRCGVALITHNGVKYLPQQLQSILAQTRAVTHIVVSDDCSTDGTWEYLEAWASEAPVRVTLVRNDPPLGVSANFEQAMRLVDADIVFSSDQDDVWMPDKVALLAAVFEADDSVQLAHTDAILVDANGRELGSTLFDELEISRMERRDIRSGNAFRVYCRRNVVTGAAAAFRRRLIGLVQPLPPKTMFYHDGWLALMAAASGRVVMLDTPTIQYRQHGANLVGVKRLGLLTKLRRLWWAIGSPSPLKATTDSLLAARAALYAHMAGRNDLAPSRIAMAQEALDYMTWRGRLPADPVKRCTKVAGALLTGRYHTFAHEPWVDALRDSLNR
jgi:hypothetical protein